MTMKVKTLLKGHTLLFEGKVIGRDYRSNGGGAGGCSCGARSDWEPNTASRQRWHKAHKEEMRKFLEASK